MRGVEEKGRGVVILYIFEVSYGINLSYILSHTNFSKALGFKYGTDTRMAKKNNLDFQEISQLY